MKQIQLRKSSKFVAFDDEDFGKLSKYKWFEKKKRYTSYAIVTAKIDDIWKTIWMHRFIVGAKKGQEIDHRDGNGLNNQRDNLRFCTHSQNGMNRRISQGTSKYKGVCCQKNNKRWQAQITINQKHIHLGVFKNEIDAAKAYNTAAIEHFGEYARLNDV